MDTPQKGTILLAEPFLKENVFKRSAIIVCRHTEEGGTFGFAINKLLKTTLNEIINDLAAIDFPVYLGGPMQKDTLHFIHQYPHFLKDAERIFEGVYWGGDFETLKKHLKNGTIHKNKIKFILGYSGWSQGQLEEEIIEESWILTKADKNIVFETEASEIWQKSMILLGGKNKAMAYYPTDPQLN